MTAHHPILRHPDRKSIRDDGYLSEDPSTWLRPGNRLMAGGFDWVWCYAWFREVPDFPGYCVGHTGTVWSCVGMGPGSRLTSKWRPLKPIPSKTGGYKYVTLRRSNKSYARKVHRLILLCFVGPCPASLEGCHKDGNLRNNHLNNLKYDTHKQNIKEREDHGRTARGERSGNTSFTRSDILKIRQLFSAGYCKARLASMFKVSSTTIRRIVTKEVWRHV
jgi:hypothetical protein